MNDRKQGLRLIASGSYLPSRVVSAQEAQEGMEVDERWILKKTGVQTRHFAGDETIASMAATAVREALEQSSVGLEEIDLLIAAGGTPDQPVPHNASLIHAELGFPSHIMPLDVGATCLSFVAALQLVAPGIASGSVRHALIVSSEKPSVGLNDRWPESAALLGDGAVAFVVGPAEGEEGILFSRFETHSEGVHLAEIPAGGTRLHPKFIEDPQDERYLFKMDGKGIYRLASQLLPDFMVSTFQQAQMTLDQFALVVPHQASMLALRIIRDKLGIPRDRFFINIESVGNLVAASIPMALHEAIGEKRFDRGDRILLLGTGAGLTLGTMGLIY
ncbi:MAG: 3-oxoacyl-[acyl-carrier-protein] synthase III C-terminal domain-containing protein [Planctomycetota bacterium]|nr:3-oxoacyl-[acyl-carrier-protein] synthase III C-terminal domain-containing protein [Planctomycetota bacterium]